MITNCTTFYGNVVETESDAFEGADTNYIVVCDSMDFMVDSGIELMHYLRLKDVYTIPEGAFGYQDYYYEKSYLENIYIDVAKAECAANAHESASIAQVYAANGCVSEKIDVSSYQSVLIQH